MERSGAFDRLNQSSVAMLAPLFDPALEGRPQAFADRSCAAIAACARAAEAVGVRSLGHLASLLVPYVRRQAKSADWPQVRDRLELWIGDVVGFCAGQIPEPEAARLAAELFGWPGFPAVPDQFIALIDGRLRQDARLLAEMAAAEVAQAEVQAEAGPAPAPRSPAVAAATAMLEASESSAGARDLRTIEVSGRDVEVARDELAMLAEAVDGLREEFAEAVDGLVHDRLDAAQVTEFADLYRDRLANLASAMRFVGLGTLAGLLDLTCENLVHWQEDPARADVPAASALSRLPGLLADFLRAPAPAQASPLVGAFAAQVWPIAIAGFDVDQVAASLARVALIESRQVTIRPADIGADDLSLAIPADADANVVDNLLRELPALSTEFSAHVERILAGALDEVYPAQRIAHTLKGSANTVGVRGVATLTHQLEDLLQLIHKAGMQPPAALAEDLALAADCLGEMTDAVAGIGAPPANALSVCRSLADWITRIVGEGFPEAVDAGPTRREEAAGDGATQATGVGAPGSELAAQGTPDAASAELEREVAEPAPQSAEQEVLRVPAKLVDRMLDLVGEAAILMSQLQEQMSQLSLTRGAFRIDAERLQDLSAQLERLVDTRGVALVGRRGDGEFDALELDEFDELHTVSRRIAEAGADGKVVEQQLDRQAVGLAEVVAQLERAQADLRDTVMRSRMVSVATIAPRLQRAVRQAARMSGKRVELMIHGEPTAVDAHLLQSLIDPLNHLLRNAVDHGIEAAEIRERVGKPSAGRIDLSFEREGHDLAIVCQDDGAGLDQAAVRARAVEGGMLAPDAAPTEAELSRLILQPGFTTRDSANQLSGRGFGMDVVHRGVMALRGTIRIASAPGRGLQVSITVPERMVAIPVVVARTSSHVLALSIRGIENIVAGDGAVSDDAGALRFVHDEGMLRARRLDEVIGLPPGYFGRQVVQTPGNGRTPSSAVADAVALLVRGDDGELVALLAPELSQTRNVVIRPLPSWLPRVRAVEGAAVLGDGAVAPVIDLPMLLSSDAPTPAPLADSAFETRAQPVCLVVDDSVSVRRAMAAFLSDLGFTAEIAGDGVEAIARIDTQVPDIALIDLEMPRMNGLELARALREDPRTRAIPIIMITSRYSEKHRAMAHQAGVDVFMTKPYSEDDLAMQVRRCLERRPGVG